MSSLSTMRRIAGAGQFDVHPSLVGGGSLDVEILSRSGIFFYDHKASGVVLVILPSLSEDQNCVGFMRNASGHGIAVTDESATLELSVGDGEGAIVQWIGSDKWAAVVLQSGTVT
jgi:hypothetical protein